jgi:hypothetical protein
VQIVDFFFGKSQFFFPFAFSQCSGSFLWNAERFN